MDYSQYGRLEFRRKFWKLFGAHITMFDSSSGAAVGYIKMKAFKLRDDVRLFRDEQLTQEVFRIHARQIVAMNLMLDVVDSATNQTFCVLKRRGLRSALLRDHWELLDAQENQFGMVQETSSKLAIARRWLELLPWIGELIGLVFMFIPQTYDVLFLPPDGGQPQLACKLMHRKNPMIVKLGLDATNVQVRFDQRINIAIAAMLSIMDAAKSG